jgi:hypothetical protein
MFTVRLSPTLKMQTGDPYHRMGHGREMSHGLKPSCVQQPRRKRRGPHRRTHLPSSIPVSPLPSAALVLFMAGKRTGTTRNQHQPHRRRRQTLTAAATCPWAATHPWMNDPRSPDPQHHPEAPLAHHPPRSLLVHGARRRKDRRRGELAMPPRSRTRHHRRVSLCSGSDSRRPLLPGADTTSHR